jgi:predicted ArsR family transcriptional regulator
MFCGYFSHVKLPKIADWLGLGLEKILVAMSYPSETSDARILELLAQRGPLGVSELSELNHVTATAVRQRLARLMLQGLVGREIARAGRGRPSHRYQLTELARRQAAGETGQAAVREVPESERRPANNFPDLALALWEEVRAIRDPEVRRGLFARLAASLTRAYGSRVNGDSLDRRLEQVREVFAERHVPMEIEAHAAGRQLTVVKCPYPELAERDRGVCAMEKMLFSELLETPMRLSACRLDGHACCQFETGPGADIVASSS